MLAARRGQARSGHFGNTADGHAAEWRTCKYAGTAGQLCDGGRAPGHDRAARPMGAARCDAACRASAQHRLVGCGRARQYGNTAGRQIPGTAVRGNNGNNTMDGGASVMTGPRGPRAARRSAAGRAPACPPACGIQPCAAVRHDSQVLLLVLYGIEARPYSRCGAVRVLRAREVWRACDNLRLCGWSGVRRLGWPVRCGQTRQRQYGNTAERQHYGNTAARDDRRAAGRAPACPLTCGIQPRAVVRQYSQDLLLV